MEHDVRQFQALFDNQNDQDVRRTAIAAVRAGYAVVPVAVGGKAPICTLSTVELRQAGRDHDCGVHHAITDPKTADRVFSRLCKNGQRINLGVVAGPSRLLVVDADTAAEVAAFQNDWADAEGETYRRYSPTVSTPGLRNDAGAMVHKDGGHWYFEIPDGVEIPWAVKGSMKRHGYDVRWGLSQTLVPPSVRVEGRYVTNTEVLPAPRWLIDLALDHIRTVAERRLDRAAMTANDAVAAWSVSVPWSDLLEPHGWTDTGKLDRCGCPIWTRPGGGSTSWKSATAHEADCVQYQNIEGHGPLHLWTTEPPDELMAYVAAGTQTITKLQFVAATEHGNDVDGALEALGIGSIDLDGWLSPDGPDASDGAPSGTVRDDPSSGLESVAAQQVSPPDDPNPDDLTTPSKSTPSGLSGVSGPSDVTAVINAVLSERGIPDTHADRIRQGVAKALIDSAVKEVVKRAGRRARADSDGWIGTDEDVRAFLRGDEEPGPSLLPRTDGQNLLYAGRTNVLVGRRGAGKTWLAIYACAGALSAGLRVLYYDMEDVAQAWRSRMKAIGCDIDRYVAEGRAMWMKPPDMPEEDVEPILQYAGRFDLVVFDVINRLITRLGGTPDSGNREVMWLYDNLFDPLAQRFGAGVLVLDHPNKKGQRSDSDSLDDLVPAGGAMKMNNAGGHVIGMIPRKPFTRDDPSGRVDLYTLKDRSGHFEDQQPVGRFMGDTTEAIVNGVGLALSIGEPVDEPDISPKDRTKARILDLLEKAHEAGHPWVAKGYLTPDITEALRRYKDQALEDLVAEGAIDREVVDRSPKYRIHVPDNPDGPDNP